MFYNTKGNYNINTTVNELINYVEQNDIKLRCLISLDDRSIIIPNNVIDAMFFINFNYDYKNNTIWISGPHEHMLVSILTILSYNHPDVNKKLTIVDYNYKEFCYNDQMLAKKLIYEISPRSLYDIKIYSNQCDFNSLDDFIVFNESNSFDSSIKNIKGVPLSYKLANIKKEYIMSAIEDGANTFEILSLLREYCRSLNTNVPGFNDIVKEGMKYTDVTNAVLNYIKNIKG